MIHSVCSTPFLGIALRVAMVTMHFHIAQSGLFLGTFFSHTGYSSEQIGTNEKMSYVGDAR